MTRALGAGVVYFLLVFAIGFVLGTVRVLTLEPTLGKLMSVTLELPLMLAASYYISGLLIRRLRIRPDAEDRLLMGLSAFALLLLAEVALAVSLMGETPAIWARSLITPAGAFGLFGQGLFALMPLFWLYVRRL